MSTVKRTQIPLKILVDKARNRVLFAEADYMFVDILFSFLTLPMGTIIRLIRESTSDSKLLTIGSFNNLYKSLENLPTKCFWNENECKAALLNPINSLDSYCAKLKINLEDTISIKYFRCKFECDSFFSVCCSAMCSCGDYFVVERELDRESFHNDGKRRGGVFVTETPNFIITDDLHVKPNLIDSSIQMLFDMGITDMTNIEEMTINIGRQQVLDLLRMALFSTHPLTDLFLQKAQTVHELLSRKPGNISLAPVTKKAYFSTNNSKKINAKAFVRKSNGEFLFIQAGGDFIDFLFSFIGMPLGTVAWLVNGNTNICSSIDNLYKSVSSLNVSQYMQSHFLKEMLLQPPLPKQYMCKNQFFTLKDSTALKYMVFSPLELKDPKWKGEFFRGKTMFMVTDDLVVTPLSSVSALSHLNNLKVSLSDVVEYEVSIGVKEALEILKASLTSSSALSQGLKRQLLKKPKWKVTSTSLKLYHKIVLFIIMVVLMWLCYHLMLSSSFL